MIKRLFLFLFLASIVSAKEYRLLPPHIPAPKIVEAVPPPQTHIFAALDVNNAFTGNNTHSGTETFTGPVPITGAVTTAKFNNFIYVDGTTYPLTPAGINSALAQASTNGGGTVIIGPGTIAMGTTSINMASNVCLKGAGAALATTLSWSAAAADTVYYAPGIQYSCLEGLTLSYPFNANNAAIRVQTSDAAPVLYNTFRDLIINWGASSTGAGTAAFYITTTGPSFTDFRLNTIDNVTVNWANSMIACTGCEGDYWNIRGQNIGRSAGSTLAFFGAPDSDEVMDIRVEAGSLSATPLICLGLQGSNNIVRLTCDGASPGQTLTAVNDTGTYNILDIDGAIGTGTFSIGTIGTGTQWRFITSATGLSTAGGANYRALTGIGSGVAPAFSQTFNALYGDITAVGGSGTAKTYGVVGAAKTTADALGDRAYGGWFKSTASVNVSTEVGVHAEVTDAGGNAAEFALAGTNKSQIDGNGIFKPVTAGAAILGTTALPIGTIQIGTAATNNFAFTPAATAAARTINMLDPGATSTLALDASSTYVPATNVFTGAWICTNVTPVTANANVATDQNLMACTIPAGVLNRVGRTLRLWLAGVYTTPAASVSQMTVKVKLCTVSGCGSGTVITPVSIQSTALASVQVTNDNWSLEERSTTQTAGASSAYEAHGDLLIDLTNLTTGADSTFGDTNTATVGTIDSTAQLFLQCTFAFSTASASNSVTQRQLIAETIN